MNVILYIAVGGGCTCLGILKAWGLRNRLKALRDLKELLHFIQNRICFDQMELCIVMKECSQRGPKRYRAVCNRIQDQISLPGWNDFTELWEDMWTNSFDVFHQKEELDLWIRLGRQLGRGGLDQQLQCIQQCVRNLDRLEDDLVEECKQKGKLYCSLGTCIGLFVTILLI